MRNNENRVELSIHTKKSDNLSTISVQEAFDFAVNCGYRAIGFTNLNNVQDFPEIQQLAKKYSDIKVIYGAELLCENDLFGAWSTRVLVKNQSGVRDLYKIISSMTDLGNTGVFHEKELLYNRENLLFGSCGEDGELFYALNDGASYDEILAIAKKYDFLEIFPSNDIKTREIYREIADIGEKLDIPLVAVGDCHYCYSGDEICHRVVKQFKEGDPDNGMHYLRNAEEMLREFAYLGEEKAFEVVVKNTNSIADSIGQVVPLREEYMTLEIPNAEADIRRIAEERAHSLYGNNLPTLVSKRLETELQFITNHGFASFYMLSHLMVAFAKEKGIPTTSRGGAGSSFVTFLLGISNTNPLPPHYYCKRCKKTEFLPDSSVYSGYDLPSKNCPVCGERLASDGQNIPFESFMGLKGDKLPDIDINFPGAFVTEMFKFLCDLFGEERVVRAGTIYCFTSYHSELYAKMYEEVQGLEPDPLFHEFVKEKLYGIKRGEGYHPGSVFILPDGRDIFDYTPIKANPSDAVKFATLFDFHALYDKLYKADVLGQASLDMLFDLQKKTGVDINNIPFTDPKVIESFTRWEAFCIPEFDTPILRYMLLEAQPRCFGDLVKITGFAHGTNVWNDNGENLVAKGMPLSSIPCLREDIMNDLVRVGAEKAKAFKMSEAVRKGLFAKERASEELIADFKELSKPLGSWYFDYCSKIRYCFPKAHATEYVALSLKLAWFKEYYPKEFYTSYLTAFLSDKENLSPEEQEKYNTIKYILSTL